MRVYHDLILATRIQINVYWSGSGSGQMIRIQPGPDTKHLFIRTGTIGEASASSRNHATKNNEIIFSEFLHWALR